MFVTLCERVFGIFELVVWFGLVLVWFLFFFWYVFFWR